MTPDYRSLFGIEIGDTIWTSYGPERGRVSSLSGPWYVEEFPGGLVVSTWPSISLTYDVAGEKSEHVINHIRREGDRWFTDQNDEVFIEKPADRPVMQMTLFDETPMPDPYPFRPGVDYSRDAWHCDRCGDFNGKPLRGRGPAYCPVCNRPGQQVIVMPPRTPGKPQASSYQALLGIKIGEPDAH